MILLYHRIIPGDLAKAGVQAGMYVEPDTFEAHLSFLQTHFRLVLISKLPGILKTSLDGSNDKPFCVLTFDDGWHDFYEHAFPILKKYQIPATVFLPTGYIGSKDWFWTDRLSRLLSHRKGYTGGNRAGQSSIDPLVIKLEMLKGSLESILEEGIKILKPYPEDKIEEVLAELSVRWKVTRNSQGRGFLNWEEVREMADSRLISFGSHTVSHRTLTLLKTEQIDVELRKSRQKLIDEGVVNPAFIPFSYPNGDYNGEIARLVKNSGYGLAVTTEKGWNRRDSYPFALKRVAIHQDITFTKAMYGCRLVNLL
jgi:peptidoglycan/xylan/chitin deacetylase (PgdA/CDA1 family)